MVTRTATSAETRTRCLNEDELELLALGRMKDASAESHLNSCDACRAALELEREICSQIIEVLHIEGSRAKGAPA
jgi:hypothetical protein